MTESNDDPSEIIVQDATPVATSLVANIQAEVSPLQPSQEGAFGFKPMNIFSMTDGQISRLKLVAQMYQISTAFSGSRDLKSEGDYFLIMLKGLEIGVPPMTSIDYIDVIQGKPVLNGKGMLALVQGSPACEDVTIDNQYDDKVIVTMRRKGRSEPYRVEFGKKEADKMLVKYKGNWIPLSEKPNYKSQDKVMWHWRAITACTKLAFPDVIGGMYLSEELSADISYTSSGEIANDKQQINESGAPIGDIIQGEITTSAPPPKTEPQDEQPVTEDAPQEEDPRKKLVGKELNVVSIKSPPGQTVGREIYWEAYVDYDEVPGNVRIRLYEEHFEIIAGLMTLTVPSLKKHLAKGEIAIGDDNIVIIPDWHKGLRMESAFIPEQPASSIQTQAPHKLSDGQPQEQPSGDFWTQIYGDAEIRDEYGHLNKVINTIKKHFPAEGEAEAKGYPDMKAWLIDHKPEKETT